MAEPNPQQAVPRGAAAKRAHLAPSSPGSQGIELTGGAITIRVNLPNAICNMASAYAAIGASQGRVSNLYISAQSFLQDVNKTATPRTSIYLLNKLYVVIIFTIAFSPVSAAI